MDFDWFSGIVTPIWRGQIKLLILFELLYDVFFGVEHDKRTMENIEGGAINVFCKKPVFATFWVTFGPT